MTAVTSQDTILEQRAAKICGFDLSVISPEAYLLAKTAIIDTLGVTIAGASEPCTTLFLATPGVATAAGNCSVLGTSRQTLSLIHI